MACGSAPARAPLIRRRWLSGILRGARPADLPIEQPTRLETALNLRTAEALGLTIPAAVLLRVDEAIR